MTWHCRELVCEKSSHTCCVCLCLSLSLSLPLFPYVSFWLSRCFSLSRSRSLSISFSLSLSLTVYVYVVYIIINISRTTCSLRCPLPYYFTNASMVWELLGQWQSFAIHVFNCVGYNMFWLASMVHSCTITRNHVHQTGQYSIGPKIAKSIFFQSSKSIFFQSFGE